jgi:hypothetical protein
MLATPRGHGRIVAAETPTVDGYFVIVIVVRSLV